MRLPSALIAPAIALALPFGVETAVASAVVRKVIGKASAPPNSRLEVGANFATAARSKSEIAVGPGLVRVGEQTDLQTTAKGLLLRQGVSLVANPPGTFRKAIEVRTAGYRLKVRGTIQVAVVPGRSMKIVVLEGSATIALDSVVGEYETLGPGQMLIINPSDNRLPEPVEIDLQRLASTSALVGGEFGALPTAANIAKAAESQTRSYARQDLISTPFFLRGSEPILEVERARSAAGETARGAAPIPSASAQAELAERSIFNAVNDLDDPQAVVRERPWVYDVDGPQPFAIGDTAFKRDALNRAKAKALVVSMTPAYRVLDPAAEDVVLVPFAPPRLFGDVSVSKDILAGSPQELRFVTTPEDGFDQLQVEPGAYVHTPAGVGLGFLTARGIAIESGVLTAGTGRSELLSITALGGKIEVNSGSILTGGKVAMQGEAAGGVEVMVDASTVTGRTSVAMGLKTTPAGITIRNSSQIVAALGTLEVTAKRAGISVERSSLSAKTDLLVDAFISKMTDDNGVEITTPGVVSLRDVQLMARAIRVRGYSPRDDALIIDGSRFKATQFIKLFAEGASALRFRNAVSLDAPMAILAGRTVEVDPGGSVTISGKGRVFTDNPNFNGSGYGTISAGKGLSVGKYPSPVGF